MQTIFESILNQGKFELYQEGPCWTLETSINPLGMELFSYVNSNNDNVLYCYLLLILLWSFS